MKLIFIMLLLVMSSISGMDPKKTAKEWTHAKREIQTCIGFDKAGTLEPLLEEWGSHMSQQEKNEFLLDCYARPNVAPLILALGCNPNVHEKCQCWPGIPNTCKKVSILHVAAERGNPLVAKALLAYDALVDAIDSENEETPLMKACRVVQINGYRGDNRYISHYCWTITYLLRAGADVSLKNKAGKTALQIAQEIADPHHRTCIVNLLPLQKIG